MIPPILKTKLYIPPLRNDYLPRRHLIDRLDNSAAYPLTLISASAGFGKTTLLSAWAAGRDRPTSWLSLDSGDNDPVRFLTYLIAALQTTHQGFGQEILEILHSSQNIHYESILINLVNEIGEFTGNTTLILDDYHEITGRQTNQLAAYLIDHLPPQLRLVVASRIDPPWPLARYRVRNQLAEIRSQDLSFTLQEAAEFLNTAADLTIEQVQALEERTEGWIAGLQLAALSLQGRDDIAGFVRAFTGSNLYVAEYLVEEILKQQPEEIQSFLLQTSILERLNAGLCEAVTGCQDGQTILNNLHRSNVFVIPLDQEAKWFRYHHLFADLLMARLPQTHTKEEIAQLHTNAAGWYEQQGQLDDAIHHTLAANDHPQAAALVDRAGQTMVFTGQHTVLRKWLDSLPAESFQINPRLAIYRSFIDLSQGVQDMYEQTLIEIEESVRALPSLPENDQFRTEAMVYLSIFFAHQNTARAIRMASEALQTIPEGNRRLRASVYSVLYRAHGMDGDIDTSAPAYRECFRLSMAAGEYGLISDTTMVRAFDLCQYGRLDEAAEYCRAIIQAGPPSKRFYPAGPASIGLAGIHLERNQLDKAEEYLNRGIEICRLGNPSGLYTGSVQKVRLLQAQGDLEGALKALQSLEQTFQRWDFTLAIRQVSLRLAMGDVQSASLLIDPLREVFGDSPYASQLPLIAAEAFKLCLVRVYIARNEIGQALRLLDEIRVTAEPGKRLGRLLEVHLLSALALQKESPGAIPTKALDHLERALDLAIEPGFVTLFMEEGPALVPLLNAVAIRPAAPDRIKSYAIKLLTTSGEVMPAPSQADELVEQLTPREIQVLLLMAAGDSNQTIAGKLVISVRTVKKHTGNIYGKLNAGGRTQALALARELGLLPSGQ